MKYAFRHIMTGKMVLLAVLLLIPFSQPGAQEIDISLTVATDPNTPEAAAASALDQFCPALAAAPPETEADKQQLQDFCRLYINASASEQAEALHKLSARSTTSQTTMMMRGPFSLSVDILDKRLAALRKAARSAQNASLDVDINGSPIPASSLLALFDGDSGGGASADEPSSGRLSGFISGGSIRSEQLETSTLAGFHAQTYNVTAGMDYRFTDKVFAGAAARYSSSEVDLNDDDGSMDAEDGNLTFYGTYYPGQNWYVDGTMHYGQGQFDLTRRINFSIGGTPFDETAESDTEGNQYGLSVGSGYEWYSGDGAVSLMTANLRYNKANIDEYTEKSGGGFNLNIHEQSFDSLILKLGGQISKAYSQSWGVILPQVNINYFHEFIEDGEQITASFVSDDTNTQFAFTTEDRDKNYFSLGAGAVVVLPGGFTAYLQGEVYKAIENYKQSIWSLGARWEF